MGSAYTPRAHVPYPVSSDTAVIASDIEAVANFIDGNIPTYVQAASAPASPVSGTGEFWWCTNTSSASYGLNYWNGSAWTTIGAEQVFIGSSAPASPYPNQIWVNTTSSNPSIQYYTGSNWSTILPATGTPGLFLQSTSSGPAWAGLTAVTSFNGRTGIVAPGNSDYLAVASGGLTGATAATRLVGGTTGGAPVTGTFQTGDLVVDQGGALWICSASGSPGTWDRIGTSEVAVLDLTGQNSAQSITTLYTAGANGLFQIAYYAKVTTPATTSSTLGPFTVTSTDPDGAVITTTGDSTSQNSTTSGFISGVINVYAGASTQIQFALGYSSNGATNMLYDLHIVVSSTLVPSNPSSVISFNGRTGVVTPQSGDYTAAQVGALPLSGGTMTGAIAMGSHKITGLTNGSASTDAAAFGQIPTTLSALSGTLAITAGGTNATSSSAALTNLGGVPLSVVTTAGDIPYATGSAALTRLGIGTAGQVLATNAGASAPTWISLAAGTPATATQATATITAATVISGSLIQLPTNSLAVGSRFKFTIGLTKTGAGTNTWAAAVKFGTGGTTSDAAIATFTSGTNTALADQAILIITVNVLSTGSSATANCLAWYTNSYGTATTGLGSLAATPGSTATFNSGSTTPYLHVDLTPGSGATMTAWCEAERLA